MLIEAFLFFVTFLLSIRLMERVLRRKNPNRNYPPSIPSIPFLGSLPFMVNSSGHLPKFFLKKSEELGPIFTLNIGNQMCLVLNSLEVIEEALMKKSSSFSGRQQFIQDVFAGNVNRKGITAGQYNAYWKYHQKLSLSILREFGFGNKNIMDTKLSLEVKEMIKFIKSTNGRKFYPKDMTLHTSGNIIHQILFAERYPYTNGTTAFIKLGVDYVDSLNTAIEVAPWLRYFPYFKQIVQLSAGLNGRLLNSIEELVNDVKSGNREECFVSKYLEKEGQDCEYEQMSLIIKDLFLAGMDTTATTVLWSLLFLANHQDIQKKLQREIDEEVSRSRLPGFEDKEKLPYLEAFILEIQRIKTIAPLAVPHQTLKDVEISGYFVPAGTMVMPNLYAVHMDPKFWKDPEEFRPERFLDEYNNIINKERCIPFSIGRRSCLGEVLARQELFQIVSVLVQNFDILPPEDHKILDDKENVRVLLKPSSAFQVRMIYRSE